MKKFYNFWTISFAITLLTLLYLSVLYPWINRWGATDAEVSMPLAGDGTQPGWVVTSTRVVTVNTPASQVWKWVVQLGQDRAGFYSNDWLETWSYPISTTKIISVRIGNPARWGN